MTRLIGILTATVWLCSAIKVGFRNPHAFHMVFFIFILWNIASFFWSDGVDETIQSIKSYLQMVIMVWILWDIYTTPKALIAALQAYILGAYVTIGSTIYNFLTGQIISDYEIGRYAGAGLNAVDQTLILALGIPLAWHLATSSVNIFRCRFPTILNYSYIPLSLLANVLTGSRTSFFVSVPAIFYIIGTADRIKPFFRIFIFAIFLCSIVAIQHYIPEPTMNRLATVDNSIAEKNIGGRAELWRKSTLTFLEHPVFGIGSGALNTANELGTLAHNTFISILAELGLIGFSLFGVMLAIVAHQIVNQPKQLSMLWITVILIWAIGSSTLSWEYRKQTWLFLNLIVISANMFKPGNSLAEEI